MTKPDSIQLPERASMRDYQSYIHDLESLHGWLNVDLVHNCFLMGEEVGELFKAIRRFNALFSAGSEPAREESDLRRDVAHELVDVLNYLLAIANRLEIDVEKAFREKNAINQTRSWSE